MWLWNEESGRFPILLWKLNFAWGRGRGEIFLEQTLFFSNVVGGGCLAFRVKVRRTEVIYGNFLKWGFGVKGKRVGVRYIVFRSQIFFHFFIFYI